MENWFEVDFLQDVIELFENIEEKARDKIIFNIHKVRKSNDPKLFKKLTDEIWELCTQYNKKQYRLFAFRDKTKKTKTKTKTLVVATHGITENTDKRNIESKGINEKIF